MPEAADTCQYALHHGIAIIDLGCSGCVLKSIVFIFVPQMPSMASPFVEVGHGQSRVRSCVGRVDSQGLLEERASARKEKDFARADALRDGFAAAGVLIKDTADGATWELSPNFDPAKLEALK